MDRFVFFVDLIIFFCLADDVISSLLSQYGGVKGYIEPLPEGHPTKLEFKNGIIGTIIPSEFIPAIEKGFIEACEKSAMTGFTLSFSQSHFLMLYLFSMFSLLSLLGHSGHPIEGVRFVLEDGKSHAVDSNELSFRLAALNAVRQAFEKAAPQVFPPSFHPPPTHQKLSR